MQEVLKAFVFELDENHGNLQLQFLTKDGVFMPLYEVQLTNEKIDAFYRQPLLLKLVYAGHRSQL